MYRDSDGFGMESIGMGNVLYSLRCAKPKRDELEKNSELAYELNPRLARLAGGYGGGASRVEPTPSEIKLYRFAEYLARAAASSGHCLAPHGAQDDSELHDDVRLKDLIVAIPRDWVLVCGSWNVARGWLTPLRRNRPRLLATWPANFQRRSG